MALLVDSMPKPVRKDKFGVFRVGASRISLDSVVQAFNEGLDAAEIREEYISLSLAEVHAAIAFYLHNKTAVDKYLEARDAEYERLRSENLKEFPQTVTREILLARKNGEDPNWPKSNS